MLKPVTAYWSLDKMFHILRERWTFKQIEKGINNSEYTTLEMSEMLPTVLTVMFGEFGVKPVVKLLIYIPPSAP
ncbi:hypothetical protein F7734_02105 [Scytonema sp. UIC 10036]|uniref:hypothetical protein n=1 Tax=Scytonema sp. UIC 10036 TaxID=2304196 RepID=UPI0012DA34C6|nr:hypothetical protein [Scytonema sp. UIC 10036]MUG91344.1 hypothetical protein [Scytonema sp. UIC 10036]